MVSTALEIFQSKIDPPLLPPEDRGEYKGEMIRDRRISAGFRVNLHRPKQIFGGGIPLLLLSAFLDNLQAQQVGQVADASSVVTVVSYSVQ